MIYLAIVKHYDCGRGGPLGVQAADIRESVGIIEHDLFGVERIERRTGLSPQ